MLRTMISGLCSSTIAFTSSMSGGATQRVSFFVMLDQPGHRGKDWLEGMAHLCCSRRSR